MAIDNIILFTTIYYKWVTKYWCHKIYFEIETQTHT